LAGLTYDDLIINLNFCDPFNFNQFAESRLKGIKRNSLLRWVAVEPTQTEQNWENPVIFNQNTLLFLANVRFASSLILLKQHQFMCRHEMIGPHL
jgi:hypothetical protein